MDAAPNLVHNHVVNRLIGLILILALALVAPAGSFADPDSGFLEQYAATYRFNLGLPSNIKVTPHGDQVLFLRSGPRSFVNDLWCFEVATRRERVLLTAARVLHGGGERLTAEESARRERQRVATRGIVSYDLSEDGRRVLVPLAGRLFVIERGSGAIKELNGGRGFPIDPQFSPDGSQVACVRNGDLRVFDVDSGRERTITSGASATITHGLAEFVAQEEMDRFSGYWWSPDSRRIAYQETDTAPVEVLHIMDPAERDFSLSGEALFVDPESRLEVAATAADVRGAYQATVTEAIVQVLSDSIGAAQVTGAHVTALSPDAESGLPDSGVNVVLWRGPAAVEFAPATIDVKDGKAVTTATFTKPGNYVLRGVANDGELTDQKDVSVRVNAPSNRF